MSHLGERDPGALPGDLAAEPRLRPLLERFLAARGFERQLAAELADLAADGCGACWSARRLAALMLHRQALLIPPDDLAEHGWLFARLGLSAGPDHRLAPWLLAEGFTTTEPRRFVREFRAWLARSRWLFRRLRGTRTTPGALRAFAAAAGSECRLPLARYLFSPAEVMERIRGRVRVSRGVASPLDLAGGFAAAEAERALSRLPPYEAAIARDLREPSLVYWVADGTDSRFNSLLAQPPGTVALVVRPPGSCMELEIKRSGCRGLRPWDLVVGHAGERLASGRGFIGASMLPQLQSDARQSSRLAAIFRRVHGTEAPLGSILALAAVYGVPSAGGEEHLLDYFTQPPAFGAAWPEMRRAMQQLVARATEARPTWRAAALSGELGLTLQFLYYYPPGQGIVSGTSSLRLDRVARYLGAAASAGEREHGDGLHAAAGTRHRARHVRGLTDEMLDEVLGLYTPPRVPYRGQRDYVAAAFAVAANRARANRTYGALMREAGRLWGTLLAVRGYSAGESFVARNVGLRSCWEGGRWRVRIVFMDHDGLILPDPGQDAFRPIPTLHAMELDEIYLLGRVRPHRPYEPLGAAELLARIYRVGRAGARAGKAGLRRAAARAYHRTQAAVRRDPGLAALFHPAFVRRLGDWDEVARIVLATPPGGERTAAFAAAVGRQLAGKGYGEEVVAEYLAAAQRRAGQIRRSGFLYRSQ